MKKIYLFLFSLFICNILAAQDQDYKIVRDISYTQSKNPYAVERCKLDLYYPENAKDFPTVVWFHGGGLSGGSKFIPEELKNFVAEHNAATPSRHHFMVGATERVFGAVLSFEKNETEADTVYPALEAVEDKNLLPFAIDPFGNYICYQLNEKQIVYWDHENDAVTTTGKSLKEFIESLY